MALIIATSGDNTLTAPESVVGSVVTPVSGAASSVTDSIAGFFQRLFRTTDTDKELTQALEHIAELESSVSTMNELKLENQRLKELLSFRETMPELDMVAARVTGKNPGIWFGTFTINVGRVQQIKAGMPVLSSEGLVGYILEVGATWSKVISIIDSRCSIPAIVERTRDDVMIRGSLTQGSEGALCKMYNLRFENDLVPKDRVLTSGLGGRFPKGILIGEIIEVSRATDETQSNAIVKPAVNFTQIEEVLVVTTPIEGTGE